MSVRSDTELSVLSYVLFGDNPGAAFSALSGDVFTDNVIRSAFIKGKALWKETGKCDLTALQYRCNEEELNACKVSAGLFYPSMDIESYVGALQEATMLDNVKQIAVKLQVANTVDDVLKAESDLQKITRGSVKSSAISYADYVERFLERKTSALDAFQTGMSKLDRFLIVSPGDFIILAGEQSSGKTAFSLELMNRFASRGYRCAYFSLETEEYKLGDRAFCNYANLDFNNVKRQELDVDDWEKASTLSERFAQLPVKIVPAAGRTVEWIKAEALRQDAQIIFVDYLGLISPGRGNKDKSYEITSNISKELHTLAQSEKITVIALQQQNRAGAGNASMHSLRDSSQLESDADAILILTIPKDEYGKTERDRAYDYLPAWQEDLNIAKNKDGDRVTIPLIFDGQHQRFYEMETRYE